MCVYMALLSSSATDTAEGRYMYIVLGRGSQVYVFLQLLLSCVCTKHTPQRCSQTSTAVRSKQLLQECLRH
jgi:hypothetical protein